MSQQADDLRDFREALDQLDLTVLAITGNVEAAHAHTEKYHRLAETLTHPDGYLFGESL